MRRDGKRALFANAHPNKALIPTFDDLTNAESQRQSVAAIVARVKFVAIGKQFSGIMNLDQVTLAGFDGAVRGRVRRLDVQFLWW